MRRAARVASSVLIIVGVLFIADAAVTLAWQEPVSAILADIDQSQLSGDLDRLEAAPPSALQVRALRHLGNSSRRIAFLARALRRALKPGRAIGRISIPQIGARFVVVEGTDTATLRKGPGHYPATPLPGLPGTVAIAGHRTTYLAPFRQVDKLRRGDPITLDMPYARFTYRVEGTRIVPPTQTSVTRRVGYDRLVLSACHPLYSAAKRIIIFARLSATEPRGPALSS